MSHRLFQCLSPAKEEAEPAVRRSDADESRPPRRSRSVVSAFLSLFRSESPDPVSSAAKATTAAEATTSPLPATSATTGASDRRRRHHSAGSTRPTSNSRMRLKRDRCPKCHGMLPLKTPELPPVVVRPGQARRRRDFKEDSGCIMAESRRAGEAATSSRRPTAVSRPEDSGNFSMSSGLNSQQPELLPLPPPPPALARPAVFGLYGTEFSTCVPRIPNRDAPMGSGCLPIRG